MKLNLLPTYVSKEKATRSALLLSIVLCVACILGSVFLVIKANSDWEASKDGIAEALGKANKAKETAEYADTVLQQSTVLLRNTALAESMLQHNKAYPDLYDDIRRYVPSFFRVTNMQATSLGPTQSTVVLTGVLDTYQQYADVMLAFLRMEGVTAIQRSGFTNNNIYVPAPTEIDQVGRPRRPGEAPIPDNPLDRLDYYRAQGGVTGFSGAGGFGTGVAGVRGPMPGASQVQITLVIARNLQTPDPRATLRQNTPSGQAPGQGGPGGAGGNLPTSNTNPAGAGRGAAEDR